MITTLYVVRHGESEGNVNGDIFGADPPLTEKGIHQAQTLSLIFESITLHHIYASHLRRAHKTAQIIADAKCLTVSFHDSLRERHFGSLEGKTAAYGQKHYGHSYKKFNTVSPIEQMNWKGLPDIESFGETLSRVLHAFDEITHVHEGKTLLLASHANVMLSLLVHLQFAIFNQLPKGSIQNTAYIKIEKNDNTYSITETLGITKT